MPIGDIPASAVIAIATIVSAGIIGVALIGMTTNITQNLRNIQENNSDLAGTSIKIIQVSYYDSNNTFIIWVKNTGIEEIEKIDKPSVFLNDKRLSTDKEMFSTSLLEDTDNDGNWDPKETVKYTFSGIEAGNEIVTGQNVVKVVTYNGGDSDKYTFSWE